MTQSMQRVARMESDAFVDIDALPALILVSTVTGTDKAAICVLTGRDFQVAVVCPALAFVNVHTGLIFIATDTTA